MDVLFPLAVFAIVGPVLIVLMTSRLPREEAGWLVKVLLAAYLLRIAAATMFVLFPSARIFHEDAEGYEAVGMAIARWWRDEGPPILEAQRLPQNYGTYYVFGAVYYVFGACRVAASYFNGLLGTATVFLVYRLARRFFHLLVARRAALLTALVPSMILWSSLAIKDPLVTFLIVLCLYQCIRLKEKLSVDSLLGTVLPIIAIQPIRFYLVYILGVAVLLSLFLERGAQAVAGFSKQITVLVAFVLLLGVAGFAGRAEQGVQFLSLERVAAFREGMATTANSGFAADADISTPGRALMFLPIGMTVLLFSPFPWQFTSLRASFALPEMLVWWFLVPSLWRGIRFTLRERFAQVSPVLLFAAMLTVVYSFTHGNIGSGFRQRAQIFVFLFIFTSVGQYRKVCRQRGIDEQLLLNPQSGTTPAATATAPATPGTEAAA